MSESEISVLSRLSTKTTAAIARITMKPRTVPFNSLHQRRIAPDRIAVMVEEGKPAPDFELSTDNGARVKLSSLRGKPVVLYFYPKDDTPGCTTQACGIRD